MNSHNDCPAKPASTTGSEHDEHEIELNQDEITGCQPLLHVQFYTFSEPLVLRSHQELPNPTIAFETFGTLNDRKDNAILICHALSGNSHIASHDEKDNPGWWENLVGPGKPVDTNHYFVICPNILGGCSGSTGPGHINPKTGQPYGMDFPTLQIADMVEFQRRLIDERFGISRLLAVIGGSLGGIMALEWGTLFPDKVAACLILASSAHLTSQSLAFDIVARNAILNDPHFYNGQYQEMGTIPATGLAIARMLAHITYLSLESMRRKFGADRNNPRKLNTSFETKFSVGSYLAHQGDKFVERFDANSYIKLSMAIDLYEFGATSEERIQKMRNSMCRWLFISFTSDWLFPPFQTRELVDAALANDKRVTYCNIASDGGHDAFLLENELPVYGSLVRSFLYHAYQEVCPKEHWEAPHPLRETYPAPASNKFRIDYDRILELIPAKTKILDLGCGKGGLLSRLKEKGHDRVVGLEMEERYIVRCVENGLEVIHADLNDGLNAFSDQQFDFVILSKTLQSVRNVELVLEEMLRVGTRAVVSFPNLGFKSYREELIHGHAPQTDRRPGKKWFNTNDVRFLTIDDFKEFCQEKGYKIHQLVALNTEQEELIDENPNDNADVAIVVLSRNT